jgi:hypothetical protein
LPAAALADGFVLGAGVEGDSAEGRALAAFGEFGVGERTWLSASAFTAETTGIIEDNETRLFAAGVDHFFDPVGIRLGGGYWGNPDILNSRDVSAAIYLRGAPGSLALEYERRAFQFNLQSELLRGRTVEFSADGWGASGRLPIGERVSLYAAGMAYEYSRNLRIQQDIDVLAFISRSRLSMINNLIDHRVNAGVEFRFGLQSFDVSIGRWQAAIDGTDVNSVSVGFLTPIADRLDAEFRFSLDQSEVFGDTQALSVYLYYFGGS